MNDVIMDGVWIINVRQETGSSDSFVIFGAVLGFIIACIISTIVVYITEYRTSSSLECDLLLFELIIICPLVGGCIGGIKGDKAVAGDVVYDVMIGDNVPFNEFTEQYEIICQNGNIYTVKERTNR